MPRKQNSKDEEFGIRSSKKVETPEDIFAKQMPPSCYSFRNVEVDKNALKIGFTKDPLEKRIGYWKRKYGDAHVEEVHSFSPVIENSDGHFYEDHAIHSYLINEKGIYRLQKEDFKPGLYYSNEFFRDVTLSDIKNAQEDIAHNYHEVFGENKKEGAVRKYNFYDKRATKEMLHFTAKEKPKLRESQQEVVRRFKKVYKKHSNLLLYAVMRFGKTFTALECAKEMGANYIIVVSAKADVGMEWQENVEKYFTSDFGEGAFLNDEYLQYDNSAITKRLKEGKKVVLFLTLQNLISTDKKKLTDLFSRNAPVADMLIVDETHFGARAERFGKAIKRSTHNLSEDDRNDLDILDDEALLREGQELEKQIKRKVTLHLSGTPYRILMSDEFSKEEIICHFQYSDLSKGKEKWYEDNPDEAEWKNPYYGFPEMLRFGYSLNESSLKLLKEAENNGYSFSFRDLFAVQKNNDDEFVHKSAILELLRAIDGSKREQGIFPFLDYVAKNPDVPLFKHMVMVLPRKKACDAMQKLINDHFEEFGHLQSYKVLNIAGNKSSMNVEFVKDSIRKVEEEEEVPGKPKGTISLTVKKMLTGTTVPQWDSMLFLSDTRSPEEYDQAIYRIQNPNIGVHRPIGIDKNQIRDEDVVLEDLKPQTVLVDFSPNRLLEMVEKRSVSLRELSEKMGLSDKKGVDELKKIVKRDIKYSPLFISDRATGSLIRMEEGDLLPLIAHYSANRGIADEIKEIEISELFDNKEILEIIIKQTPLYSAGNQNIKTPAAKSVDENSFEENLALFKEVGEYGREKQKLTKKQKDNVSRVEAQIRSYYKRIAVYSFLSKTKIESLTELIASINNKEVSGEELSNNKRIAKNLGLTVLDLSLFLNLHEVRSDLDFTILKLNQLSREESSEDSFESRLEKIDVALRKFGRMGVSEIVTPSTLVDKMVALLPEESFVRVGRGEGVFLDIASKQGEFARGLAKRFEQLGYSSEDYKNAIYSIPTSTEAYEYTRRVYELLNLNIDCIAVKFNSYDLVENYPKDIKKQDDFFRKIQEKLTQKKPFSNIDLNDSVSSKEEKVKFEAIMGNPPYQLNDGGGEGASAIPLYNLFVDCAKVLSTSYVVMIIQARWYSGGKGLDEFRKKMLHDNKIAILHDFQETKLCFPDSKLNIRGGVCFFLWDRSHKGDCKVINHISRMPEMVMKRALLEENMEVFVRQNKAVEILRKVRSKKEETYGTTVYSRNVFGIASDFDQWSFKPRTTEDLILYRSRRGVSADKKVYIGNEFVKKNHELIEKNKVLVSKASPGGDEIPHAIISKPIIAEPNSVCTETYLIIDTPETLEEANNLISYMQTKFFRFMMSLTKNTQNISRSSFMFVPKQPLFKPLSDEELYKKYGITLEEQTFINLLIK